MDNKVMTGVQEKTPLGRGIDIEAMSRTQKTDGRIEDEAIAIQVENLNLYYGQKQALKNINLTIPHRKVTAFIGPSGCGKSTLLRCFNRMNDLVPGVSVQGEVLIDGANIYDQHVDPV